MGWVVEKAQMKKQYDTNSSHECRVAIIFMVIV